METQDADTSHKLQRSEPLPTDVSNPLLGVILCCTSVPADRRTRLAEQAQQMGAQHNLDLTSEVTHLIVGDYNTPKYRYVAKERPDVKVLTVDWVEAVRQLWIEDKAIDVAALEQEHRLPTFAGMRICLTGFEDSTERAGICELVQAHGASYHGDLTKNITHLIARRPEGSKYKHAKLWNLQIVSLEWITDSVQRGMILEEHLYNPEIPAEQRGKDAWNRDALLKLPPKKRKYEALPADEGRRKLRRTASTKLTGQNEKIWGDIVGSAVVIQAAASGVWEAAEDVPKFNKEVALMNPKKSSSEPIEEVVEPVAARGTFSDCQFYIHGFDEKKFQVLERHLTSHDAEISLTPEEFITQSTKQLFLLVPHSVPEARLPDLPECDTHIQTVTEWWVERCLDVKSFVDPSEYTLGRPFPKFPIPKFSDLAICSTGFAGTQLLHLAKAVTLLGAKYDESFSKNASVLICNPARATRLEKLISAQQWRIPLVSPDWLLDSIESGSRQRYQQYLQRPKKPRLQLGIVPVVDEELIKQVQTEPVSVTPKPSNSRLTTPSSEDSNKAPTLSKLDRTAFHDDQTGAINAIYEASTDPTASTATTEPITNISPNSPGKQPSQALLSASKVDEVTPTIPQEVISSAITSILAKSKYSTHPLEEGVETRKKRAPSRILGRAPSIASNSGASFSRASSVDSTASTGAAVIWPKDRDPSIPEPQTLSLMKRTSSLNPDVRSMTKGGEEDTQQPQTQMQYEDAESSEYKARVVAKMTGQKVVRKEVARVATVASLREIEGKGPRKTRLRDKMTGRGTGLR